MLDARHTDHAEAHDALELKHADLAAMHTSLKVKHADLLRAHEAMEGSSAALERELINTRQQLREVREQLQEAREAAEAGSAAAVRTSEDRGFDGDGTVARSMQAADSSVGVHTLNADMAVSTDVKASAAGEVPLLSVVPRTVKLVSRSAGNVSAAASVTDRGTGPDTAEPQHNPLQLPTTRPLALMPPGDAGFASPPRPAARGTRRPSGDEDEAEAAHRAEVASLEVHIQELEEELGARTQV
eukprot:124697-Chlamydomonas_euryale.AAC.1